VYSIQLIKIHRVAINYTTII